MTQWLLLLAGTQLIWLVWMGIVRSAPPRHPALAYGIGVPLALIYALVLVNVRWLCRAFPLRAGRIWRAIWIQAQAAILLALAWSWGAGLALERWAPRAAAARPWLILASLGFYSLAAAIAYAVEAWRSDQQAQRDAAEARLAAREAELRALRAQINPHFLFNCLHSIAALAGSDAGRARAMCLHLSELYRLTLGLALRDTITLGEELSVLRAYVAVEAVRFGPRLQYEEDVPPALLQLALPALLLQPLVENAVKHGIAGLTGPGELRLEARQEQDRLRLILANDYDPDSPPPAASGHGLENIRRRLAAYYGAGEPARLWLERQAGRFIARLELPAIAAAAPAAPARSAKG